MNSCEIMGESHGRGDVALRNAGNGYATQYGESVEYGYYCLLTIKSVAIFVMFEFLIITIISVIFNRNFYPQSVN